jgi:hypothetical protein
VEGGGGVEAAEREISKFSHEFSPEEIKLNPVSIEQYPK